MSGRRTGTHFAWPCSACLAKRFPAGVFRSPFPLSLPAKRGARLGSHKGSGAPFGAYVFISHSLRRSAHAGAFHRLASRRSTAVSSILGPLSSQAPGILTPADRHGTTRAVLLRRGAGP